MAKEGPVTVSSAETIRKFLQGLEVCAPAILEGLAAIGAMEKQLRTFSAPYVTALAQADWANMNRWLDDLPNIQRRLDELPQKSKEAMILASAKGWFFGWFDSLQGVTELIEKLKATKSEDIDEVMAEYYRKNLQFLTDELVNKYSDRAHIIKAAVNAHRTLGSDGYLLSIPIFIAQADGLLTEITKVKSAMMKDRGQQEMQASRALREKLASDQESLDLIYPVLKLHELDFMKSADERQALAKASGKPFTALNRHQVMHGESLDYGTEVNSLKAFSFLVFVGAHLPMVLEPK